ncbi:MerR family transcriptional regulator [Pseudonocardiaceae bacterium YIM PH 21723]|nr:MerR family transcriptional regulator [Pseudonocardiaceae bacterium YIM PH 21723]
MSIGAVLAQLRPDFPEVTISKIRFLETEGLVAPERTSSGYRQFGPVDVERLRFVLAAQRDHYLPLKVIKEQLDAADGGLRPPRQLVAVDRDPAPAMPADFLTGLETRLTREDLLAQAVIGEDLLTEIIEYGLIKPGAAGFFAPDDVTIAATVRSMTHFGLEPRHLRAFRTSADREVGLLAQITAPVAQRPHPQARDRAAELARELAALSVTLHTLLVKIGLREAHGG